MDGMGMEIPEKSIRGGEIREPICIGPKTMGPEGASELVEQAHAGIL